MDFSLQGVCDCDQARKYYIEVSSGIVSKYHFLLLVNGNLFTSEKVLVVKAFTTTNSYLILSLKQLEFLLLFSKEHLKDV